MTTDAEIEAAVKAMRAIPTRGGRVHDDVLRAYVRAALALRSLCSSRNIADEPSFWRRTRAAPKGSARLRANAASVEARPAGPPLARLTRARAWSTGVIRSLRHWVRRRRQSSSACRWGRSWGYRILEDGVVPRIFLWPAAPQDAGQRQ
jgi:hypothetical protein